MTWEPIAVAKCFCGLCARFLDSATSARVQHVVAESKRSGVIGWTPESARDLVDGAYSAAALEWIKGACPGAPS